MDVTKLVRGQNILVLRYSPSIKKDIIEQHQTLIEKLGYCWYGKLGGVTSREIISAITASDNPSILLYSKGKAFLCGVSGMGTTKPKTGYPKYYDDEYIYPSCYFKLISIDPVDLCILDELYVRSSERRLSDVLSNRCRSSSFFVSYREIQKIPNSLKSNEISRSIQ